MDPFLISIIAAVVAGGIGYAVGLGRGRSAGHASGRAEGHRVGVSEGRDTGLEEGKKLGLTEGRRSGSEEGRREGRDEGRKSGLEEGRRQGREEGHTTGFAEGRTKGYEEGRTSGYDEGRSAGLEEGRSELRDGVRASERDAAMREAIARVSAYLKTTVRDPLSGATEESEADELRERIGRAMGALQDLDFFIEDVEERREGTDLVALAQSVARDFAADQEVGVRISLGASTVYADVNGPALMDALYLVLHNAGRFGQGSTVDLSVVVENGSAVIRVRDRGDGFSEEAFQRAFDPFYSSTDDGLGLGLPHARKAVERMGGAIELRNVPDGGAEVEITFPLR
ncbi:MAG: ATP-binding protein [Gemmatimonadota bacterium]